jgi:mannobiose 2-epimerase
MTQQLHEWWPQLRREWQQELEQILQFWSSQMIDEEHGGFLGRRNVNGVADPNAPKGVVLNARILWTFSTAARQLGRSDWQKLATRSFQELGNRFVDTKHGGVYWSITSQGIPYQMHKQTYAQAFAIYGFAAYYQLTSDPDALALAVGLFHLLEQNAVDHVHGGYVEARNEQWQPVEEMRLSAKEANWPKTMNTHLHVLEAYTLLYKVWPHDALANAICNLLQIFLERILQPETGTQGLFFTMDWQRGDSQVSFGHDIEAVCQWSLTLVNSARKGIDKDGGMWNEYNLHTNHWSLEKHWWPQAEAMVGFCDAWQNTGEAQYLEWCRQSWGFIQQHLLQPKLGEWKWGIDENGARMENEDLAGFWKCPYHNGRALMELLHRLQ